MNVGVPLNVTVFFCSFLLTMLLGSVVVVRSVVLGMISVVS